MRDIYESLAGQMLAIVIKQFFQWEKQKWDKIITQRLSLLPLSSLQDWTCYLFLLYGFKYPYGNIQTIPVFVLLMQKDMNSVKGREDSLLQPNTPGIAQKMPPSSTTPD